MNSYLPLYAQIREALIGRITAGEWSPGTALPSENALASEMGVSQGTVRKALDSLCTDGALERAQGRGTFVAEQTPERSNFRFFRLVNASGQQVVPELLRQDISQGTATAAEARALNLSPNAPLHRVVRVRSVEGAPALLEKIALPADLFAAFAQAGPPPNALYPFYQSAYRISVLRTDDQLAARSADAQTAAKLNCAEGAPLLCATRTAYDLTDRAVELRVSLFVTEHHAYAVSLR